MSCWRFHPYFSLGSDLRCARSSFYLHYHPFFTGNRLRSSLNRPCLSSLRLLSNSSTLSIFFKNKESSFLYTCRNIRLPLTFCSFFNVLFILLRHHINSRSGTGTKFGVVTLKPVRRIGEPRRLRGGCFSPSIMDTVSNNEISILFY